MATTTTTTTKHLLQHPSHHHPLELLLDFTNETRTLLCCLCGREISVEAYTYQEGCDSYYYHVECATRFPSHKHYLHEHKLLRFEKQRYWVCNRCRRGTDSPLFRCVPCNFNLHEECMELPQVVKSKIHWHLLTLHETFVEDDTGEYYCEHCEKTRDPRLGAYVCGQCKLELPRIYHIECALPELEKVNTKKRLPSVFEKLSEQTADKKEEVRSIKEKLEEATRDVDELVRQRNRVDYSTEDES